MAGTWTKLTTTVKVEHLERASSVISMLDNGLMIEDFSDFTLNGMYGELVDESILGADRSIAKISIFVPEEKELSEYTEYIKTRLSELKIPFTLTLDDLMEEDWAQSWKQYFKPIPLGIVTIVPAWEKYDAKEGEIVIRLDPGMAFGTGNHETTRLVMRIMQDEIKGGEYALDVGCGSGILSICAVKLGAASCNGYDIDPVAVKVAIENANDCGLSDKIKVGTSDLLSGVERIHGGYGVCVANIVAEIIIRMLPELGGYLAPGAPVILSGIVSEKADEVCRCAEQNGYRIERREVENDWVALLIRK